MEHNLHRRRFEENNPIPAAIWNNHLLVNPDEIMPQNFTTVNRRDDIALIGPYINKLQKNIPKMVDGTFHFKSTGKLSALVFNKMPDLRLPPWEVGEPLQDFYRRAYTISNKDYYSYGKLTAAEQLEGQINLLGILPCFDNLRYPTFSLRRE